MKHQKYLQWTFNMFEQKFKKDSKVFVFYFDRDTAELKYREAIVSSYDYMDGPQWNVVDEYTLYEFRIIKKWFFFKKTLTYKFKTQGHIISDDINISKAKFLHYFLKKFSFTDNHTISTELSKMIYVANSLYNELLENEPHLILKAINDKLSEDDNICFWN